MVSPQQIFSLNIDPIWFQIGIARNVSVFSFGDSFMLDSLQIPQGSTRKCQILIPTLYMGIMQKTPCILLEIVKR